MRKLRMVGKAVRGVWKRRWMRIRMLRKRRRLKRLSTKKTKSGVKWWVVAGDSIEVRHSFCTSILCFFHFSIVAVWYVGLRCTL